MSAKRLRYDGAHEEVVVYDSQAGIYAEPVDVVKRGGLLTDDAPAHVKADLRAAEEWTEVDQPGPKKDDKKGDA
jgi:hypothetical protein